MKKILSFVSILMVILGVITLVTGIMDVGLLLGSDGGAVAEALAVLAVVVFVAGGLLGLRAAKDPARSMGAIVFGFLALAAAVASAALAFNVTNLCACIIPLVYFICALAVRSRG